MTAVPVSESAIHILGAALRQNQPVAVYTKSDGSQSIRWSLGIFSRVWHWRDVEFHAKRYSDLAGMVARIVAVQPRMTIEEASHDQVLVVGRKLLKQIKARKYSSLEIEGLKKEITAAKLGITTGVLDRNPGLQRFVEQNHLERYLLHYGHAPKVNEENGEVSFLLQGKGEISWREIARHAATWQSFSRTPVQPWNYGREGVQHQNMYEWTELKPYMTDDPSKWHHQYVFEICSCYNPESTKEGNHSWMRLKTPSGDIYSVGLYRPGKSSGPFHNIEKPFRTKPAYLMQPDVSEFWDFAISSVAVIINEDIFYKIKARLEADKAREDELVFHTINDNCLLYCKKIGALANVKLPTKENIVNSVLPERVIRMIDRAVSCLPRCIQKVCHAVTAFFINIGLVFLGSNHVDKTLTAKQRANAVPQFRSLKDLFDIKKSHVDHPSTFAFKVVKKVQQWRERMIAETISAEETLEVLQDKIWRIQLSLPPEYYETASISPIS